MTEKVKIVVSKAFKFNQEGTLVDFKVGTHEVESEIAENWYVQAHLAKDGEAPVETTLVLDTSLIQAELNTALQEIDRLKADIEGLISERDALKAEVEALKAAAVKPARK